MLIKMFIQDSCPNCPKTKRLGKELLNMGANVKFLDVKTADGLGESLMHNVLSTPSTVIVDEKSKEIKSWLGKTPALDEVKKWL